MPINKGDLVDQVAQRANLSKQQAAEAVDGVLAFVKESVAAGEKVIVRDFGTWSPRARAARTTRNPRTGEVVNVAAKVVPVFKAAASFADAVRNLRR